MPIFPNTNYLEQDTTVRDSSSMPLLCHPWVCISFRRQSVKSRPPHSRPALIRSSLRLQTVSLDLTQKGDIRYKPDPSLKNTGFGSTWCNSSSTSRVVGQIVQNNLNMVSTNLMPSLSSCGCSFKFREIIKCSFCLANHHAVGSLPVLLRDRAQLGSQTPVSCV